MIKKLPDSFDNSKKRYSWYEDIEYKAYWEDPSQVRQDHLEQHIIMKLLPISGRRIIDLGCGYSRLFPCYAGRFAEIVLFDGSLSLLRQAREATQGRALCVAGDVSHLPFKKSSFDCVLIIRVLQHAHELHKTFMEIRRVLGREGSFIFSYHNKRNAHRILNWLLLKRIVNPFSLESKEVCLGLLSHHPNHIKACLHNTGFSPANYQGALVLNSIAKIVEKISSRSPSGSLLAPFLGKHKLAPWLIGQALAQGGEAFNHRESSNETLQCPICQGALILEDRGFHCFACSRIYPILDGIIDMRP